MMCWNFFSRCLKESPDGEFFEREQLLKGKERHHGIGEPFPLRKLVLNKRHLNGHLLECIEIMSAEENKSEKYPYGVKEDLLKHTLELADIPIERNFSKVTVLQLLRAKQNVVALVCEANAGKKLQY